MDSRFEDQVRSSMTTSKFETDFEAQDQYRGGRKEGTTRLGDALEGCFAHGLRNVTLFGVAEEVRS